MKRTFIEGAFDDAGAIFAFGEFLTFEKHPTAEKRGGV